MEIPVNKHEIVNIAGGKSPVNKHEVMDDILNIAGENVKEERDD